LNTVVSMGKQLDCQGCSRMTFGMAGGCGEQANAVRDRNQFVGAAEGRQVRTTQTQHVRDRIVVLFALCELPEVLVGL
jgi:hypothetical protein